MGGETQRRRAQHWTAVPLAAQPMAGTPQFAGRVLRPGSERQPAAGDAACRPPPAATTARTAADVMRRHVLTARENTPVAFVLGLLMRNRISRLPIVDETGCLVGLVTDYSLITYRWGTDPAAAELIDKRAADLMEPPGPAALESTPLPAVAEVMRRHAVDCLPVLRDGRLVGLIGRSELLEALAADVAAKRNWC